MTLSLPLVTIFQGIPGPSTHIKSTPPISRSSEPCIRNQGTHNYQISPIDSHRSNIHPVHFQNTTLQPDPALTLYTQQTSLLEHSESKKKVAHKLQRRKFRWQAIAISLALHPHLWANRTGALSPRPIGAAAGCHRAAVCSFASDVPQSQSPAQPHQTYTHKHTAGALTCLAFFHSLHSTPSRAAERRASDRVVIERASQFSSAVSDVSCAPSRTTSLISGMSRYAIDPATTYTDNWCTDAHSPVIAR